MPNSNVYQAPRHFGGANNLLSGMALAVMPSWGMHGACVLSQRGKTVRAADYVLTAKPDMNPPNPPSPGGDSNPLPPSLAKGDRDIEPLRERAGCQTKKDRCGRREKSASNQELVISFGVRPAGRRSGALPRKPISSPRLPCVVGILDLVENLFATDLPAACFSLVPAASGCIFPPVLNHSQST